MFNLLSLPKPVRVVFQCLCRTSLLDHNTPSKQKPFRVESFAENTVLSVRPCAFALCTVFFRLICALFFRMSYTVVFQSRFAEDITRNLLITPLDLFCLRSGDMAHQTDSADRSIMMSIFSRTARSAHRSVSGRCQNKLSHWCMTSVKSFKMDLLLQNGNCSSVWKHACLPPVCILLAKMKKNIARLSLLHWTKTQNIREEIKLQIDLRLRVILLQHGVGYFNWQMKSHRRNLRQSQSEPFLRRLKDNLMRKAFFNSLFFTPFHQEMDKCRDGKTLGAIKG